MKSYKTSIQTKCASNVEPQNVNLNKGPRQSTKQWTDIFKEGNYFIVLYEYKEYILMAYLHKKQDFRKEFNFYQLLETMKNVELRLDITDTLTMTHETIKNASLI